MEDQQKRLAEELLFSGIKKPTFGKKLYFGLLDLKDILPFPVVSSEEQSKTDRLLDQLRRFAEEHIDPDQIDRQAFIPDEVISGLGSLGVLGMTIPVRYGGLGMSQYAYCKAVEAVAERCGSTALFINADQSIGLKALLLFGTEEQKQRWLPPLAKGEFCAAFALTEPNAGSDASGVETRAVFDSQKNVWRINGKKQWITNGSIAKVLTVMAQTEVDTPEGKQDKITAFLVNPDMPGFKVVEHALEKVGMRGTKTAVLEFHDMEVPAENVLGPMGGGLKVCLTVLDYGRTTFGAMCTGAAKYLVSRAIDHAVNRRQFKRPLSSFELVKRKIAEMSALLYATESATYLTAGLVDRGVEDIMLESAMLKVFASDSLWTILYDTMQIFGGRSFFTSEPFERMMRDARLNMIGEGSNEVMRAFIGVVGMRDVGMQLKSLKGALSDPVHEFSTLKEFSRHLIRKVKPPEFPVASAHLKEEAVLLGKSARKFGFAIMRLLAAYREDILEKQLVLDRVANCAMAIYTATAALSRIDFELQRPPANELVLKNEIAIVKFYCRMAFDAVDKNIAALWNNHDEQTLALADLLTGSER